MSPEAARAAFSSVSVGDRLTPDALVRRLVSAGFAVVSLVEAPGQVARRGGIIDVYAPQDAHPARIEFFGPEVESIRRFEVVTQRSTERVETLELGIAAEFSPDAALAAELLKTLDFSALDEEHDGMVQEELRAIANGETVDARSFLPALLSHHSLLDHLPDDAMVILDEPADLSRALDEYVAETATMRLEREARGQLPIGLPPAQANWIDLQPRFRALATVELQRFGTEEAGALRPGFSPAPGFGGRVRVLARDLNEGLRKGESVVIVSQQSSRLHTLLQDEGLPVSEVAERADRAAAGCGPARARVAAAWLAPAPRRHRPCSVLRRRGVRLRQAAARAEAAGRRQEQPHRRPDAGRLRRPPRARHRAVRRADRAQRRRRAARVPAAGLRARATSLFVPVEQVGPRRRATSAPASSSRT